MSTSSMWMSLRCGSDQVKVEIAFCGVCGTDIHVMNDTFRNYPPVILGHEFAGKVVEKGVKVTDVKLGENVTCLGATAITCGRCQYCVSGEIYLVLETGGVWGTA